MAVDKDRFKKLVMFLKQVSIEFSAATLAAEAKAAIDTAEEIEIEIKDNKEETK